MGAHLIFLDLQMSHYIQTERQEFPSQSCIRRGEGSLTRGNGSGDGMVAYGMGRPQPFFRWFLHRDTHQQQSSDCAVSPVRAVADRGMGKEATRGRDEEKSKRRNSDFWSFGEPGPLSLWRM